jgi:hypothetical protein
VTSRLGATAVTAGLWAPQWQEAIRPRLLQHLAPPAPPLPSVKALVDRVMMVGDSWEERRVMVGVEVMVMVIIII